MPIDLALLYASTALEIAVVAILFHSRITRVFPVFSVYLAWTICSDVTAFALRTSPSYLNFYFAETILDSVLQFSVLLELAWSVLRPFRTALPRSTPWILGVALLVMGAAVWPLAGLTEMTKLTPQWHALIKLQQTFAMLRIIFFLVLAACSQVLAIGWRNRELQVATGLGAFSLANMAASLIHTHQKSITQYHVVDRMLVVAYVGMLTYWAFSFRQQEAPRKELSPRMQSVLLTVAGSARANRIALEELRKSGKL